MKTTYAPNKVASKAHTSVETQLNDSKWIKAKKDVHLGYCKHEVPVDVKNDYEMIEAGLRVGLIDIDHDTFVKTLVERQQLKKAKAHHKHLNKGKKESQFKHDDPKVKLRIESREVLRNPELVKVFHPHNVFTFECKESEILYKIQWVQKLSNKFAEMKVVKYFVNGKETQWKN